MQLDPPLQVNALRKVFAVWAKMGNTSDHKGLEGESAEELFAKVALGDSFFICSRSRTMFVNPHGTAWQHPRVKTSSAMRRMSIVTIVLQISVNAASS